MADKEIYFKQVEELINKDNCLIDKSDFEKLYELIEKNSPDSGYMADKIINGLFKNILSDEAIVPWGFLQTEIGKVIVRAKFGLSNDIYLVADLVELTGYSKQYIGAEIKRNNINAERRNGNWIFREKDINEYLKKKGLKTIFERKKENVEDN